MVTTLTMTAVMMVKVKMIATVFYLVQQIKRGGGDDCYDDCYDDDNVKADDDQENA